MNSPKISLVRTELTHLISKSTSPWLSDMSFFADILLACESIRFFRLKFLVSPAEWMLLQANILQQQIQHVLFFLHFSFFMVTCIIILYSLWCLKYPVSDLKHSFFGGVTCMETRLLDGQSEIQFLIFLFSYCECTCIYFISSCF